MSFCPPCPNFIASMAAYPLLSFSFKVSKYAFICFSISSEYFMRSIKFESFITCDSFQLALDIGTEIREIIYLLSLSTITVHLMVRTQRGCQQFTKTAGHMH